MVRHSITLLAALTTILTVLPVNADFLHNHLPQAQHRRLPHTHHAHVQRDVALPSGWTYIGCRGEPSGGRMLSVKLTTSSVSPGLCSNACNSAGFTAAGMQYGNECWCGYYNQLNNPSTLDESRCSMACNGDSTLKCGNSYVNSLYARTSGASTPLPAPAGWTQLGCYMDQSARTLTLASTADSSGMTVEKCMSFCPASATYFGVESKSECYCGTTLSVNTPVAVTDCVSTCAGNAGQICGGSWRLTVFQKNGSSSSSSSSTTSTTTTTSSSSTTSASSTSSSTTTTTTSASSTATAPAGWTNLGCYADQDARTLAGPNKMSWSVMTPALCAANCAGYAYFGTENGNECYCGNTLTSNVPRAVSECNVNCAGDANQKCGGGWRLTLYQTTGSTSTTSSTSSVSSTTSASSTSSSTSSTTTTSASSTATAPAGWTNLGCYADQDARTLAGPNKMSWSVMTPALCAANCAGYAYFGTENGNECYCGNTLTSNVPRAVSECSVNCAGDATQKCGGGWRLTLYQSVAGGSSSSSSSVASSTSATSSTSVTSSTSSGLSTSSASTTGTSSASSSTGTSSASSSSGTSSVSSTVSSSVSSTSTSSVTSSSSVTASSTSVTGSSTASSTASSTVSSTSSGSSTVSSTSSGSSTVSSTSSGSSTITSSISSTSSVSSTATSSTASASATAAWTNMGCYADQSSRTLNGASKTDNAMTVGMCQTFCGGSGYTYAGVENKVECYCGNSLTVNSPAPSTDCQATCGGDATQICGGASKSRITIYKYTSSTPLPTYTSVGCFVDSSSRVLPTPAPTGTAISYTAQTCGAYCASLLLPYAGVEKAGAQCFCGDRIILSSTGGALVNPSECPGSWRVPIYYNPYLDPAACLTWS